MVHRIVVRLSRDALDFWERRLRAEGIAVERERGSLRFANRGAVHELVVNGTEDEPLVAQHPEIPVGLALQGRGVRAYSSRPGSTAALVEQLMGAERREGQVWELRGERRGGWIALDPAPAEPGRQSAGTVHHVA